MTIESYPSRPNFEEGSNLVGVPVEPVDGGQNTSRIILDADYVEAWNEVVRRTGASEGEITLAGPNKLAGGEKIYELSSDATELFSLLAANRDRPLLEPELAECGFDDSRLQPALSELGRMRTDKGRMVINAVISLENNPNALPFRETKTVRISPACIINITDAVAIELVPRQNVFEYVEIDTDELAFIGALEEFLTGQKNSMPIFAEGYRPSFRVETAIRRLITRELIDGLGDFEDRLAVLNRYRAPGSGVTRDAKGKSTPVTLPGWTVKPENYSLPDEDDESSQAS